MDLCSHELITFENGSVSVKERASGQVMHSWVGPAREAEAVYILQSRLRDRLKQGTEPLVLYDVGMGIAANAIAAIRTKLELGIGRSLWVYSFENQLEGVRLALQNSAQFPFLKGFETALLELLETGNWQINDVTWKLIPGDFWTNLNQAPVPEVLYYDFYAPNSCPELWTVERFKTLFHALQFNSTHSACLYTYSAATPIRTALLLAGFYVGYGTSTEKKAETTVATTNLALLEAPLGQRWLDRYARSSQKFPLGWIGNDTGHVHKLLMSHSQFKLLS